MDKEKIELLLKRPSLMKLDEQARSEIRAAADISVEEELTYEDADRDVAQVLKDVEEFSDTVLKPILTRFSERKRAIEYEKWKRWQITKLKFILPVFIAVIAFIFFMEFGR